MALTPWLSHFKTDFELARRRRGESIAFDALRCEAFDRFLLLGCPTRADEEWRHVDISPIAQANFSLGTAPSGAAIRETVARSQGTDVAATQLTFVNGYFVSELSSVAGGDAGLLVGPLTSVLTEFPGHVALFSQIARVDNRPLVALNTALFEDGACVMVPPDTTIDRPVHVRFVCDGEADAKPAMTQPRVLIVVGNGATACIVETYAGAPGSEYFTNAVTEIALGEGAQLDHHRLQHESEGAYHISAAHIVAAARSQYSAHCVNSGARLARSETIVTLGGECATGCIAAATSARRRTTVNVHTSVEHAAANSVSRQHYRWMLDGNAVGVVTGKTVVRADAGGSRVRHVNRARLCSPDARMEVKPVFDILASEVKFRQFSDSRRSGF
jgi:Fe-S cluster assembly protein SufD